MSDLFSQFLLASGLSAKKSELKDKLQIWDFQSFIFWSKFFFFGTIVGQYIFEIFRRRATIVADFFSQPPHYKQASYGPVLRMSDCKYA